MRITTFAVALAAMLAAHQPTSRAAESARPPNLIFILVDDLRYNTLGCTGHPFVKTPNIDRIAREGANFKNAFAAIPLCAPSRASFLTGRYPHAHGVIDNTNHDELSHKLATYPRLLHDAGYETAFIGKWHMGNDDTPRPGFDRWVSFKGQGIYTDPPLNIDGKPEKANGYITDLLNQYAVDFVKKPHKKPFLLYLSHKAVHGPFTPAERHRDLYKDDPIEPSPSANDSLEGKPMLKAGLAKRGQDAATKKAAATPKKKAPAKAKAQNRPPESNGLIRNQLRCQQSIDDGVGMIYEALEATNALADSVIVFTSDNGYFWGDHGLGDKRAAYEESIRIPLVMRAPGRITPGTIIKRNVLSLDIAPTFLELAGVAIPSNLHGRSLLPLFAGKTDGWRTAFLTEYFHEVRYPHIATWKAIRTDRWKWIHYPGTDGRSDELYDLQTDPYELKNRLDDPSAKSVLDSLKQELERQLAATK